jgi:alpha-N-acetylglucosamine transferase
MTRQRRLSDLPDFLQSSPFLPLGTHDENVDPIQNIRVEPTVGQILRSKRFRTIVVFIAIALALLILPARIRNYHPLTRLGLSGPKCYFTSPVKIPEIPEGEVDWTKFAYFQYATNTNYLCNTLMLFSTLQKVGSLAERLLLYSSDLPTDATTIRLLEKARLEFKVTTVIVEKQHKNNAYYVWADSYTKLLAFNQTQYNRLIHLDSDSTLKGNLDALFFLPNAEVVLPRAYWLEKLKLASHIMVLQPSIAAFERIQKAIEGATRGTYDMEIINSLFGNDCAVLPHEEYALLTGEFRSSDPKHTAFLDGTGEWDPDKVMENAEFVHFSDYPFPKPWEETTAEEQEKVVPVCVDDGKDGKVDCRSRDIWIELYKDFKARRKVCKESSRTGLIVGLQICGRVSVAWMTLRQAIYMSEESFEYPESKFRFRLLRHRNLPDPRLPCRIISFRLPLGLLLRRLSARQSRGE